MRGRPPHSGKTPHRAGRSLQRQRRGNVFPAAGFLRIIQQAPSLEVFFIHHPASGSWAKAQRASRCERFDGHLGTTHSRVEGRQRENRCCCLGIGLAVRLCFHNILSAATDLRHTLSALVRGRVWNRRPRHSIGRLPKVSILRNQVRRPC